MEKEYLYNYNRNPLFREEYRKSEYKIDDANLYINLDAEVSEIRSRLQVKRNPDLADLGGPLELDGVKLNLKSIKIDGYDLDVQDFIVTDKKLIIKRPPEEAFTLEIVNEFSPKENTELEGIYSSDDMMMSQCEARGFRRITYYLDRPDNLATFDVTIEADKEKYPVLLSNGNGSHKDSEDLGNGRHKINWKDPFPKPSYLFAMVAGQLEVIEDNFITMSGRKIDLRIFVEKGYEDKVDWAMDSIKRSMKWEEDKYGLEYDLDCFHVVGASKFNAGAMENKGLNIFNVKYIAGDPDISTDETLNYIEAVIAHEYFHNYSGDRVTVRDWFELTLKEGLTVLRDGQFTADMHSEAIKTIEDARDIKSIQFKQDASPMAHPIRPDSVEEFDNIYSTTVYRKGAQVLGMVKTIIGDDNWYAAMYNYFKKFDGQAVTCDDFIDNMQEVSRVDLSLFRKWYSQSGTPEISYKGKYDTSTESYHLTLTQKTLPTADQDEKENLHIPVRVGLIGRSGKDVAEKILHLTESEQTFVFKGIKDPYVVPSVLRGFSAPVKVTTIPSDEELVFRMANDSDPYNRYEATERFMLKTAHRLIEEYKNGKDIKDLELSREFLDAYKSNIDNAIEGGDMQFASMVLGLPSRSIVEQGMEVADPIVAHRVLKFMGDKLAENFREDFEKIYEETKAPAGETYSISSEQVGRRAMHGFAIGRLARLDDSDKYIHLAGEQFMSANNMTERLSGLSALSIQDDQKYAEKALEYFYDRYKHNTNVVDTWLSMSASRKAADPIANTKQLIEHESFDWTNPNKVRSLVGGFMGNTEAMHNIDGSGYGFISDVVIKLNPINPKTAAGIAQSISASIMKYDEKRQQVLTTHLERIMETPNLDVAIKEVVGKAIDSVKPKKEDKFSNNLKPEKAPKIG